MLLHNVSAFGSDYSESAAPLAAEARFGMTVTSKVLKFMHYLQKNYGCIAVHWEHRRFQCVAYWPFYSIGTRRIRLSSWLAWACPYTVSFTETRRTPLLSLRLRKETIRQTKPFRTQYILSPAPLVANRRECGHVETDISILN